LTEIFQVSELIALRDAVAQLGRAIAVADLAAVETSTAQIKSLMDRKGVDAKVGRGQLPLVEALDGSSQELAAVLASRLRAFEIAIAAWRAPDPGR